MAYDQSIAKLLQNLYSLQAQHEVGTSAYQQMIPL